MKIKILKNEKEYEYPNDDQYYFNILSKEKSTLKDSFIDLIRNFAPSSKINSKIEDILVFALSIFCCDKRFSRKNMYDGWTREFEVEIPIINKNEFCNINGKLEKCMNFLTGDQWKFIYKNGEPLSLRSKKQNLNLKLYDAVSLFSGGLDSFCGGIKLASEDKNLLLIGHNEFGKAPALQQDLVDLIQSDFSKVNLKFISFNAKARSYILNKNVSKEVENTSRSRSLLFIAAGLLFANLIGDNTKLYIPENAFIGLNLPISKSRIGTCSTRTTHPFFLSLLNEILLEFGIQNQIENPFKYYSKKRIVDLVKDTNAFRKGYDKTISCSHPEYGRYSRFPTPCNCGYCYPCMIRRASLIHANDQTNYWFKINNNWNDISNTGKEDDVLCLLNALNEFKLIGRNGVIERMKAISHINASDRELFADVYEETMQDFAEILTNEDLRKLGGLQ